MQRTQPLPSPLDTAYLFFVLGTKEDRVEGGRGEERRSTFLVVAAVVVLRIESHHHRSVSPTIWVRKRIVIVVSPPPFFSFFLSPLYFVRVPLVLPPPTLHGFSLFSGWYYHTPVAISSRMSSNRSSFSAFALCLRRSLGEAGALMISTTLRGKMMGNDQCTHFGQ
jgi:hypothetical protein